VLRMSRGPMKSRDITSGNMVNAIRMGLGPIASDERNE
jgi:hypothetical protein